MPTTMVGAGVRLMEIEKLGVKSTFSKNEVHYSQLCCVEGEKERKSKMKRNCFTLS